MTCELRVGLGIDAHAFGGDTPLVLAGASFDKERRLAGHSDGDVISHALIDAVLGAAGAGDIGSLFPSGDDRWRGASSLVLLTRAYGLVVSRGYALVNADCILIGERPRIEARRAELALNLAGALGVPASAVSVRATTTDRLGFTGRGEGLAAQAVALVRRAEAGRSPAG
jgi:2-C-methyl-D-erythritol 2,4-cyclodiphosphate synthase